MDTQFALDPNGQITWQRDLTNPMPGIPVAEIKRGGSILSPICSVIDGDALEGADKNAVQALINAWLDRHIKTALSPLDNLKAEDIPAGAPREIADKIYDALGVILREDLQSLIAQMDEEMRGSLRSKKIRFGPLLVYLPELNKPATVRLRALLLTLWNEGELPATVPADGIVSFAVEGATLDKAYYQSIGYPIYGPRSIRVDMLDRVICAVYDAAKDGKFEAQHQMAEWLGSNLADLYAILEAMGHKKISDPADEAQEEVPAETPAPEKNEEKNEGKIEEKNEKPAEIIKPALAIFALKKGKAAQTEKPAYKKKPANQKFDNKPFKSGKKKFDQKKKPPQPKTYVAEAEKKPEDNPFAMLEQLKSSMKE